MIKNLKPESQIEVTELFSVDKDGTEWRRGSVDWIDSTGHKWTSTRVVPWNPHKEPMPESMTLTADGVIKVLFPASIQVPKNENTITQTKISATQINDSQETQPQFSRNIFFKKLALNTTITCLGGFVAWANQNPTYLGIIPIALAIKNILQNTQP